jgi:hypothetical protein
MSICCDTFGDRKPCVSITVYVCMYVCMHTSVCVCVLDTAQATRASESCNNSVECSRFATFAWVGLMLPWPDLALCYLCLSLVKTTKMLPLHRLALV